MHLVRFAEPTLLTSDSIVVPIHEHAQEPGLHDHTAPLIHIALDRRTLLALLPEKDRLTAADDQLHLETAETAMMANSMVAAHAEVATFEHPEDQIRARMH